MEFDDNKLDGMRQEIGQEAGGYKAAFFAGVILCVCFAIWILSNSGKYFSSPIDSKINPNIASVYELGELPSIGHVRAKAIVDYRQKNKAFEDANGLDKVKGIGEKTIEKIKQWFAFDR